MFAHLHARHFSNLDLITEYEQKASREASSRQQTKKRILAEVSIFQLKFVGFFFDRQTKNYWGLLRKADEEISKVEIGDIVGLERYVVIAIELKKMIFQANDTKKTIQLLL